jgi:hypothetical protein
VALAGESQWVRNVRAAGGQAILGRRTGSISRSSPQSNGPRSSGSICVAAATVLPILDVRQ